MFIQIHFIGCEIEHKYSSRPLVTVKQIAQNTYAISEYGTGIHSFQNFKYSILTTKRCFRAKNILYFLYILFTVSTKTLLACRTVCFRFLSSTNLLAQLLIIIIQLIMTNAIFLFL